MFLGAGIAILRLVFFETLVITFLEGNYARVEDELFKSNSNYLYWS